MAVVDPRRADEDPSGIEEIHAAMTGFRKGECASAAPRGEAGAMPTHPAKVHPCEGVRTI